MSLLLNAYSAPSLSLLKPDLISGKTVLVTGASAGLGVEAARHYARLGARRLILAVRSPSKGEVTKRSILSSLAQSTSNTPSNKPPQIDVWSLDLSSFASVQAFADQISNDPDTLDIALLNAAVSKANFHATKDGWDETLQTNLLSTVLIALKLLPKLRESSARQHDGWTSRISIVVARAHATVKEDAPWLAAPKVLAAFNDPDQLTSLGERYICSKLLLVWATREIAKLATPAGRPKVIVTYSCPGACESDLAREWKDSLGKRILLYGIQKTIAKTTEEGSRTIVLGTLLDESKHGMFLKDKDMVEYVLNPLCLDKAHNN
jgi:retinol dehydrogenase-12